MGKGTRFLNATDEELRVMTQNLLAENRKNTDILTEVSVEIANRRQETNRQRNKHILNNIEVFLPLTEHTHTSCNDGSAKNVHDCPRCQLLYAKDHGWFYDDTIKIVIETE